MKRVFLLLICFLFLRPVLAADSVILVVGDSLSAGYGIELEQGWVALLQQNLKNKGFPYKIVNASISGDTTSGGLRRLPAILERVKPGIVILELGANDGLRGLSLLQAKKNLAAMIELCRKHDARILLLGMRLPPNFGAFYNKKFETMYRQLADQYAVPLVPFFLTGVEGQEWMQEDEIHPLAKAQPFLMKNVWKLLKDML